MIKFTQLTDKLNYPPNLKGELSTHHASIVTYAIEHFQNKSSFKSQVVSILNTVSYYIVDGDSLPSDWSSENPFSNIEVIDQSSCESKLGKLFIKVRDISWDVEEKELNTAINAVEIEPKKSVELFKVPEPEKKLQPTPKEHLYIRPPTIPQFDVSKPWLHQIVNGESYAIYKSLPEVPIIQNQVSVTTDVNVMTVADLMKLYPNCYIKTRPAVMYEYHEGLTLDPDVGIIIPVVGFSPKQVIDNVVKYPHWFKLMRLVDDKLVNFYQHIEVNNQLLDTLEVWDTLPDSKKMPKTADFIKEYVVRRYLLERDLKGIEHTYPLFGSFDPFMILFTSPEEYSRLGYKDVSNYARQCVEARVAYKRTRNPIIRIVQGGV